MITLLLALLYPVAVQVERKGWWYFLLPITLVTLVIDVIANYTELALLTWDWPRKGELTFSTRLLRLRHATGWRGAVYGGVIKYLNYFAPDGKHV